MEGKEGGRKKREEEEGGRKGRKEKNEYTHH